MPRFNIPDDLRQLLALDGLEEQRFDLLDRLVQPATAGELIKLAALAEEEVTAFLTRYAHHPQHTNDKDAKLGKRAKFSQKIQALGLVLPKLDANQAYYQHHLDFLNTLRTLRNATAHSSGLRMDDAKKLASNSVALSITIDFPKQLWARITSLRAYLAQLPL